MARNSSLRRAVEWKKNQRRPLGLESLERRSVLCTVECDLTNGVLNIGVGEGEDTVSVQMDHGSQMLHVVDEGKVIQSFAASSVQNLNIRSLEGNAPLSSDRVQVDPSISVPVQVNPGATNNPNQPSGEQAGGAHSVTDAAAAHEANAAASAAAFVPQAPSSFFAMPVANSSSYQSGDHNSHFGSTSSPGTSSTGLVVSGSSESHDHAPTPAAAATTIASSSDAGTYGASPLVARTVGRESNGGHHVTFTSKKETQVELAPKFCTTTPWAKTLVSNVYGKAECGCVDKKKDGGFDASDLIAGIVGNDPRTIDLGNLLARDSRTCRPNQRDFQLGLITEGEVCSERSVDEVIQEIISEAPLVDQATQNVLPSSSPESWSDAAALAFSSPEVRMAGWALLSVGVALLPMLLMNRKEDEEEESYWSRGGLELLTA